MKKIIYSILAAALMLLVMAFVPAVKAEAAEDTCRLSIEATSERNLFFDRYEMDIRLDGEQLGTVLNGQTFVGFVEVTKGMHELQIYKTGSNNTNAFYTINVTEDMTVKCTIAHSRNIRVRNIRTEAGVTGWARPKNSTVIGQEKPEDTAAAEETSEESKAEETPSEAAATAEEKTPSGSADTAASSSGDAKKEEASAASQGSGSSQEESAAAEEEASEETSGSDADATEAGADDKAQADNAGASSSNTSNTSTASSTHLNAADSNSSASISGRRGSALEASGDDGTMGSSSDVITASNTREFSTLVTSDLIIAKNIREFAEKYEGRTVSFDGIVVYKEQSRSISGASSYSIINGKSRETVKGPAFIIKDASDRDLKLAKGDEDKSMVSGTLLSVKAQIAGVSDDGISLIIKPVELDLKSGYENKSASGTQSSESDGEAVEAADGSETQSEAEAEPEPEVIENMEMPVMPGTSLDDIVSRAALYGLKQAYEDEDFRNGTKLRPLSDTDGGLMMDIIYSDETKEILHADITTNKSVTIEQQKDFITDMAGILCPAADSEKVSEWVNDSIESEAETVINGIDYTLSVDAGNNLIFDAGEESWQRWARWFHTQSRQ